MELLFSLQKAFILLMQTIHTQANGDGDTVACSLRILTYSGLFDLTCSFLHAYKRG